MYEIYFNGIKDAMRKLAELMDQKVIDSALKTFEVLHCKSTLMCNLKLLSEKTRSCGTSFDATTS